MRAAEATNRMVCGNYRYGGRPILDVWYGCGYCLLLRYTTLPPGWPPAASGCRAGRGTYQLFVENLTGTLQIIAKDAKIQVDFNPEVVSRFRLLGYENRRLDHEDFRNDDVDGGEVGSGHSVTALYEIKLHENAIGKLATVFIRYDEPDTRQPTETSEDLFTTELVDTFEDASPEFRLAAAIAEFAEILRNSFWAQEGSLEAVHQVVANILPQTHNNPVKELMRLMNQAAALKMQEEE